MNFLDKLNNASNIFLTHLGEPEENTLVFKLTLGSVSLKEETWEIDNTEIDGVHLVSFDANSSCYQVCFDNYIGYSVINESFESNKDVHIKGSKVRVYSQSQFLEYIKASTFDTKEYPGIFKHYCCATSEGT